MKIQAVRGMNDILPHQSATWLWIEQKLTELMQRYGYQHIRMPMLEQVQLFCRSVGEVTDIVEKEMYAFEDRNGDKLALRPEGTAQCVRAGLEHGLFHNQTQRLWYYGPMFRHERPQKGRYRQFYQIGVESFGFAGPDMDAEHLAMMARFWEEIGLAGDIQLQLNTLGSPAARLKYRQVLTAYFTQHAAQLDEDSQRRLLTNPLRILDSKNPEMAELLSRAPQINDHLEDADREHFDGLCNLLKTMGIAYTLNPRLVRGLDYYCHTVYEWTTDKLGAQGTVCGGGRYDKLVEQLGGTSTPAVGFSAGIERLISLVELRQQPATHIVDAYLVVMEEKLQAQAAVLAERLRTENPTLSLILHCGGGGIKSQMKKADKSGARYALILGEAEAANQTMMVKSLREQLEQQIVPWDQITHILKVGR